MKDVTFVTLAHYQDIFDGCRESIERWEPAVPKILVLDGEGVEPPKDWLTVHAPLPFIYSRNVNLGWQWSAPQDVLLCGDDVRFTMPLIEELQRVAYSDPTIGIACPQMHGQSPFVCGYFKREMLDAVGPMDEEFTGYGFDDNDFCHRMAIAGYRTHPVESVKIEHAAATTFYRREREGAYSVQFSCEANRERFEKKWKTPPAGGKDRWEKP